MRTIGNILFLLMSVAIILFILAFANVSPFNRFWSVLEGDLSMPGEFMAVDRQEPVDSSRALKVIFVTSVSDDLPIAFGPEKHQTNVLIGESDQNMYHFTNLSDDTLYFRPVHSVFPSKVSGDYKMLDCFCFKDMVLMPHEEADIPMIYYIKPTLDSEVSSITMHYSLFKREKNQLELMKTQKGILRKTS